MQYVIPEFKGNFFFLSNFYEFPVEFTGSDGVKVAFPTNEHAFQAAKYKAMAASDSVKQDYVEQVLHAVTPGMAKYYGRSVSINTGTWDAIKINVMREIVQQKFSTEEMADGLLSTGCAMLVEGNTWGDTFWGRCDGRGYNMLGVILMETRGALRAAERKS